MVLALLYGYQHWNYQKYQNICRISLSYNNANKEGSRVHLQTAYLFLQWEMNGERKQQSPYSFSSVKQGPDSVVKKFCCEALNRYVRPHSEKLEIFTDHSKD